VGKHAREMEPVGQSGPSRKMPNISHTTMVSARDCRRVCERGRQRCAGLVLQWEEKVRAAPCGGDSKLRLVRGLRRPGYGRVNDAIGNQAGIVA
jgi:hypothetical protein